MIRSGDVTVSFSLRPDVRSRLGACDSVRQVYGGRQVAIDEDIAASLPRPPPAAPARRDAAIEAAMRRFDGVEEASPSPARQRRNERAAAWWVRRASPQTGAFVSIALVALIGLPIAWMSLGQRGDRSDAPSSPAASERTLDLEKAAPGGVETTNDDDVPALAASDTARPAEARASTPSHPVPAATPELAQADAQPAPPAPPPPTIAVLAEKAEAPHLSRTEPSAQLAARASRDIVVSGSRIRSPTPAGASSATPAKRKDADGMVDSSIVVTGARSASAAVRGDWNACTVDDPARSLNGCRAPDATDGRAAAELSSGLALAWRGDLDGAVAAFDRAIAIEPRFASAYLNRGVVNRRRGRLDRAIADIERAIRYAPDAARGYYQRSLVYRARGEDRLARSDENRVLDLDPRYGDLVNK